MNLRTKIIALFFGVGFLLEFSLVAVSQSTTLERNNDSELLYQGFLNPPDEAKPRTWWHWVGSNVTKEGITNDLEWMKRVGIGGFMMFDVSMGSGQEIEDKIVFFTPEWFDALKHAASEADRLGLEMTMHSSAGWSETGGPWVKPEEAVKKIVWSEMQISGQQKVTLQLEQPPSVNGPISNLAGRSRTGSNQNPDPTYYADIKVLAYRTPVTEANILDYNFKVTSSNADIDRQVITDNDLTTFVELPIPTYESPAWIQFEFDKPYMARAFSLALGLTGSYGSSTMRPGSVKVSDNGKTWNTIIALPGAQHDIRAIPVRTYSFPEAEARYFRIEFIPGSGITTVGGPDAGGPSYAPSEPAKTFNVLEANIISGGRVNRWEDKANFAVMFEYETLGTPDFADEVSIAPDKVLDISSFMDDMGNLNWEVPEGNWTILRMGYSLTGAKNGPAVPAGTGFEVDKFNEDHMTSYYEGYAGPIKDALGPLYGKNLQYYLVDSYEANAQNWTDDMITEFFTRRGYDPTSYLPALDGRIVGDADVSERFLWDYRRTIADLLAEEHYAAIADLAHEEGMKIYSEAAGISLPIIQDALLNKSKVDIPMGEFGMSRGLSNESTSWLAPFDLESEHSYRGASDRLLAHQADVREAASASHIYGKKYVATESWTGGGYEAPASLKLIGDYWNTQGVNRFIFHTSTHQPLDTKPGNAMVGTHIHRNITWAEQAAPFMTYLARNCYMLQQGQFVADIVYYLGEGIPSAVPYWKKLNPEPPDGYDYDFMNTEILLEKTTVADGLITLENGMQYQILVLPDTKEMTPHVLEKVRELIADGAIVIGPKPEKSPSLVNYPEADLEVSLIANEIWGDADGKLVFQNAYGKGKVYWGAPLDGIFADLKVPKDLEYNRPNYNTHLSWIHRRTDAEDVYYITNMRNQDEALHVTMRVDGKIPELWHSDNGQKEAVSYTIQNGLTTIELNMYPQESVFVVFGEPSKDMRLELPEKELKMLLEIAGPWDVAFEPGLGAPAAIAFSSLISWPESDIEGIRYYSGTAAYTKQIKVPNSWINSGERLILDLGEVRDIAEVIINGQSLGMLWKTPYKLDISGQVMSGINNIEIRVTNQWNNRIAGDRTLPEGSKVLSGTGSFRPGSNLEAPTLESSGLIGPVTLKTYMKN